jgi:hypothetical protein
MPEFSSHSVVECPEGIKNMIINRVILALTILLSLGSSLHAELHTNNSHWKVESAENGRNADYHPVHWSFLPDGKVYAGDLWHGVWFKKTNSTIRLVIFHKNSQTDSFEVSFNSSSEFTAYKEGLVYRYGVRIKDPKLPGLPDA